jgi:hypothetical protein
MKFPNFSCPVYKIGDDQYEDKRYQYATTSQMSPASMSPAAIIYPQHPNADPDVLMAIRYAEANNLAIAVRTGGHAYSGTSSTTSNNLQLDLSQAYYEWDYNAETGLLQVGVSYSLFEFNTKLKEMGLFMPTGQCYDVHVGGHAQTGGYGQLARAFGLFSDQIVSFEIFLADGTKRVIVADSKEKSDKDLFFAVLGGGPGNYGIVTHITVRPFKDSDHKYARAFKKIIPYDPKFDHKVLVQLLDLVQEWENAPGDYDFCFTVTAGEENFIECNLGKASRDAFMIKHFGEKNNSAPFSVLLVYFQYSNLDNKPNTYDPTWCNKIEAILNTANYTTSWWERVKLWFEQKILNFLVTRDNSKITPISESVTRLWTFEGEREFNYPFLKNGQVTDKVASPDWSEWAATRIDMMTGRSDEGLMVFAQCQNFGGQNSAVTKNGSRKQTSYAWRNTTVGYEFDVFYNNINPEALQHAKEWQKVNFDESIGKKVNFDKSKSENGKFSTSDHRWLWASHGNLNMLEVWQHYYSKDDYERCCKVKAEVDPNGVFSANPFAIGYKPDRGGVNKADAIEQFEKVLEDATQTKGHTERAKQRAQAKNIHLTFRQ